MDIYCYNDPPISNILDMKFFMCISLNILQHIELNLIFGKVKYIYL